MAATIQQQARAAVSYAISTGRIDRHAPCEVCGIAQERLPGGQWRVVQHHHSYEREFWTDTVPLCARRCHRLVHAGEIPEPRTGRMYPRASTGPVRDRFGHHTDPGFRTAMTDRKAA